MRAKAASIRLGSEPPWWSAEWQALADGAGDPGGGTKPVTPGTIDALGSSEESLAVWPRLTDEQRDVVRRRVKSEGLLVSGELFVCLAVAMPEESWEASNPYISNLFGPSWTRGLTVSAEAVRGLVGDPSSLPGPWLEPLVEDRWTLVLESPLWDPMVTDIVHDAAVTDRFTLQEAFALHERTCRDRECVVLDLRPDSPWERARRHLNSPSPYLRRLAIQHPGCPLDARLGMLEDDSPEVARAAVLRAAPAEFDRALLAHRRFVVRRELARFPDRTLAVLEDATTVGWERMAKWCHPRVSTLYRDAFMGHESWRVRTAYVQAHSDDEPTAARAAKDAHPRVRAALAAVKPDANGLADDTSYLVRKAVAAHTTDPAVLSRLAHDNDARVQRVAARRVVDLMARA